MNIHISEQQTMKQQLSLYLAKDEHIDPMYNKTFDDIAQRFTLLGQILLLHMTFEEASLFVHVSDENPRPLNNMQYKIFRALCDRWYKEHSDVNLFLAGILLRRIIESSSPFQGDFNN